MGMFCKYCGAQLGENATICASCGAPAGQAQPVQPANQQPAYQQPIQPVYQQPAQPAYQQPVQPVYQQQAQPQGYPVPPAYPQQPVVQPKKKKTGLIIGIIVGIVLIIAAIVVLFIVLDSSSKDSSKDSSKESTTEVSLSEIEDYQQPVEDWAAAIETNDVNKMYGVYFDCWYAVGFDRNQVIEGLQYTVDIFTEEFKSEVGDSYSIKVEYDDCQEYDAEDIGEITDTLSQIGVTAEIEAAYEVEATLIVEGEEDTFETDEFTFVVVLSGGEWDIYEIRGLPI